MSDKTIKLRWAGQGSIVSDNITPVSLSHQKKLSFGLSEEALPEKANLIIEGDNAPVMKALIAGKFQLRGKVDFMLWDPPYNTGNTGTKGFIYEDNFYLTKEQQKRWAEDNKTLMFDVQADENGVDIKAGETERGCARWVKETDASKHSKWLSWMDVRLNLAKKLLKPTGVIAVHIGYQELFRLGLLMDEVFGEENRLGIINWECAYSPKNDKKGSMPSTTDYVLVYARDKGRVFRGKMQRTDKMNARYKNQDNDPNGAWKNKDLSASSGTDEYVYKIENPITGKKYLPPSGAFWRFPKNKAKEILSQWGVQYEINGNGDCVVVNGEDRAKAQAIQTSGPWPIIFFGLKGTAGPAAKHYLTKVEDKSPAIGTFFSSDDSLDDIEDDQYLNQSLRHDISEHNDAAKKLIKRILGGTCVFDTPKPLKLTKRLLQMFCPENGLVLDAFAGSGTVGHAVLDMNKTEGHSRRFVLIERGDEKNGFANSITAERIRRVITGSWENSKNVSALGGSFSYYKAGKPISAKFILESKRDDLVDIIMTSHDGSCPVEVKTDTDIIGKTAAGNAIALVWGSTKDEEHGKLTLERHKKIVSDADALGMTARPIYIYGTVNAGPNGSKSYSFHQIPDEILAALGIQGLGE